MSHLRHPISTKTCSNKIISDGDFLHIAMRAHYAGWAIEKSTFQVI